MGFLKKLKESFKNDDEEDKEESLSRPPMDAKELFAEVNKVSSLSQANRETIKFYSEKFDKINGLIGELRDQNSRVSEEVNKLRIEMTGIREILERVEPKKLHNDYVKNLETTKMLKERVDILDRTHKESMTEFKKLRKDFKRLNEVREIIKLSKQVRDDVRDLRKTQLHSEVNFRKIEGMNSHIQKKYYDFLNYEKTGISIQQYFKDVAPKIDTLEKNIPDFVQRNEIDGIKKDMLDFLEDSKKKADTRFRKLDNLAKRNERALEKIKKK